MGNYRIISLDGGGIRGLYTAVLLDRLVTAVPDLLAETHLFAGTSTGGILALGLAAGRAPADGIALYQKWGPRIFSRSLWQKIRTLWGLVGAKYAPDELRNALEAELGDLVLADLSARDKVAFISAFKLDDNQDGFHCWRPVFFHNLPGASGDQRDRLADIGLRTSAAPTYFPSYQGHVDGGVSANSPSTPALAAALGEELARPQMDDIRLLSLGTGTISRSIAGDRNDWGLLQWARPAIPMLLEGSMDVQDFECRQLLGESGYFRLAPLLPEAIEIDDAGSMDKLIAYAEAVDIGPVVAWIRGSYL